MASKNVGMYSTTIRLKMALLNFMAIRLSRELRYFPSLLFQVIALSIQILPPDAEVLKGLPGPQGLLSQKHTSRPVQAYRSPWR